MPQHTLESIRAKVPLSLLNLGVVASPEPIATTTTGVPRGHALYDTPPPGTQPEELPRSQRSRTATKRAADYIEERTKSNQRSRKYRRTRTRNQSQPSSHQRSSRKIVQSPINSDADEIIAESEMGDRSQAFSKSPTPIPVSTETEGQPRLDREHLRLELQERFRDDIADQTTQELTEVLDRIIMLSPTTVGVGGGFHLDHPAHGPGRLQSDSQKSKVSRPIFKPPHPNSNLQPPGGNSDDSDIEMEWPIPPPDFPQHQSTPAPTGPIADLTSPFLETPTPFLGYPPNQSPLPNGQPTRRERSSSQYDVISMSSQSLGDPIRTPAPRHGGSRAMASQTRGSHHSIHATSQHQGSQLSTGVPSQAPKAYSSKARTAQGLSAARNRPPGTVPLGTRLNIVSIGSQRGPLPQTSGPGPSRRVRERTRNTTPWPSTRPPARAISHVCSSRVPSEPPDIRPRAPADLLEDDDEEQAIERAATEGTSVPARYRKPTMNDLHGNERHIVHKLKDHLWALGIYEGNIQTRGIYHGWFDALFEAMWETEMPGKEFEPPSPEAATVAINNICSRRGRVKDRVRAVIRYGCGFVDPTNDQERAQNNQIYDRNWPNSYHCSHPESEYGHYEGELVTKSITASFFHSSTAIGVKHQSYFKDMQFTIVAFVLAIMQFCLGEWKDGHFTNTKLDANYLLSLYICHYEGLKEAKKKAPVRMDKLRKKWFKQSMIASGAKVVRQKFIQAITLQANVRPDSPPPSPDGLPRSPHGFSSPGSPGPSRPLQRPRAPSLDLEYIARITTPPPHGPAPALSPAETSAPERNSAGRFTAHAKGKGRASE